MAEQESVYLWSTTALTNGAVDPAINFAEGQLPSTVNNSARAVMTAIARYLKDTDGTLTTTGSANAYLLTINGRQTPLTTGHRLSFKASFANTSTATLAVTNADAVALGAKAIRAPGDVALSAGQIISGGRYDVQYDTTANGAAGAWILLNPSSLRTNVASIAIQKITATSTYTPTAGMLYCLLECLGAGGGGGGVSSVAANNVATAGGGGAGGYSRKIASAATIGASQAVTVGAAGGGASAGNNTGSAGGDTSVGALCIGKGGSGGAGSAVTSAPGGAGGVAGTGDVAAPGGAGAAGTLNEGVFNAIFAAGAGANSQFGGGGQGGTGVNAGAAGSLATGFGSGGGGAGTSNSGGAAAGGSGTPGLVIITEFF